MKYSLKIQVEIVQGDGYGQGLRISEGHEFQANTFAELCEILVKFHELGVELSKHAEK